MKTINCTLFFILFQAALQLTPLEAQPASGSLVLMNLSAHPDDEDGAALAYYARIRGAKTYSILFTRGEGGQNETGSELGDDLGAIRVKETLEAAAVLGTEAHFLGFSDFGYSKTAKETFKKWGGEDSVLARLVYYIRALKPDVIITNHDTATVKPFRQHGNHQAVGITTFRAFEKAADPAYHPEQLHDGITPWQVKKLFFRTFRPDTTKPMNYVSFDLTLRDTSGRSIEEIAVAAANKHRSQGLDKITLKNISEFFRRRRYMLVRSDREYPFDPHELFSGISPSKRLTGIITEPSYARAASEWSGAPLPSSIVIPAGGLIGLVKSYDQTSEWLLKRLKARYELLDSTALASGDLRGYSVIILDLRIYEYRTDVGRYTNRLLEYASDGGNIVCFYHKTGDWNGKGYAPFPITLTGERVTEEEAPVSILRPEHPFFNTPNKIVQHDWDGWVQERNIYLPSDDTAKTSSQYERLLAMSDEGEQQPPTSLLSCQAGKGTYTYCSLALYRQLRNLQEGAVKLFVNFISQERH